MIVLYIVVRYGTQDDYFYAYWSLAVLDTILQLCIAYEMATHVFRPSASSSIRASLRACSAQRRDLLGNVEGVVPSVTALRFAFNPDRCCEI
jgi:hypothetical protein